MDGPPLRTAVLIVSDRVSAGTHDDASGREAARLLETMGTAVTWVRPGADGRVDPDEMVAAVREDTRLVSLVLANNVVTLELHLDTVKVVATESPGIIREAYVSGALDQLVVEIQNIGDIRTDYMVTVTETPAHVARIPAQARVLEPAERATLEFDIVSSTGLEPDEELTVTLRSSTGRVYDQVVVPVP